MSDHRIPEAIASPEGLSATMALKVVAIFVVLISGIVGAAAPVLMASCSKENGAAASRTIKNVVKVCNMLAIGIVLATALIHMIPHSIISLRESGNHLFAEEDSHAASSSTASNTTSAPDSHAAHNHAYPFTFLFAMVALTVVYIAETELNWYAARKMKEIKGVACDEHEEERQASMIKLYILEAGVFVHSIIIGITLGTSEEISTARILTIVLCIHQLFEGLAIGSLSVVAQVTLCQAIMFVAFFALGTPIGIAIGIGISGREDKVAQGVLEALTGGILLHMALVDLLPHALGSHAHHAHGPLPIAKLHAHMHSHDHDHGHGGECNHHDHSEKTAPAAAPDAQSSGNESQPQQAQEMTKVVVVAVAAPIAAGPVAAEPPRESVVGDAHADDHEEDDSFAFRLVCYGAFIVGSAIGAVLGIWA